MRDRLNLLHRAIVFGLYQNGNVVIGAVDIFLQTEAVILGARDADATMTERRIARAGDRLSGLLRVVDLGHDNTRGTGIERFLDFRLFLPRHAYQAGHIASRENQTLNISVRKRRVFGIDKQPVIARLDQNLSHFKRSQ